jgi:hypothetical protein
MAGKRFWRRDGGGNRGIALCPLGLFCGALGLLGLVAGCAVSWHSKPVLGYELGADAWVGAPGQWSTNPPGFTVH